MISIVQTMFLENTSEQLTESSIIDGPHIIERELPSPASTKNNLAIIIISAYRYNNITVLVDSIFNRLYILIPCTITNNQNNGKNIKPSHHHGKRKNKHASMLSIIHARIIYLWVIFLGIVKPNKRNRKIRINKTIIDAHVITINSNILEILLK